ncbi:MAG: proteasome assembly chaperone family protein [Nitrososphaerales archaeon]
MSVITKILKVPVLKNPVMICGLPGSGHVAKLSLDYLIQELKAELFAHLVSFSFPPQVNILSDGSVDILKSSMYYWENKDGENDLILYTGDAQPITPEAEYELSDKVTEIGKKIGVKTLFTLAAFIIGRFVDKPRVYGTATDQMALRELEKYDVILMNEGTITGMNGLLVGFAKLKDMRGICLLGETSGYILDPKSSYSVLQILTKMLKLNVDLSNLEKRAKETTAVIKGLQELQRRSEAQQKGTKEDLGYIS